MAVGRLEDGIQEAGSPEDGVRVDVLQEDANPVDDARHWEAEILADEIPVGEIRPGASLEGVSQSRVVWQAVDQPLADLGSPQMVYLVLLLA